MSARSEIVDILLRIRGARQVVAEAKAAAAGIDGVGNAADRTATRTANAAKRADALVGSLGLLGRAAKWTAVGLGIGAAAGTKIGFAYNAMQDSQRIAFETLLGSGRKAAKLMRDINQLASESPILDPGNTGLAAQRLLAFEVPLKKILPFVSAIGDSAVASGKTIEEAMGPASLAIGQIQAKGKLSAEELGQLTESVGVGRASIARALGMTGAELEETFTKGPVSAKKALPAILKAMTQQSAGAAEKMANTTAGRWDAFKENIRSGLGSLTRPLYNATGNVLASINERIPAITKGMKQGLRGLFAGITGKEIGGGKFAQIGGKIGTFLRKGFSAAKGVASDLIAAIKPAMPFIENVVLPLLKGMAIGIGATLVGAFKIGIVALRLFSTALGWIGQKMAPFKGVFTGVGVVIGSLITGPFLKVVTLMTKLGFVGRIAAGAARLLGGVLRGLTIAFRFVFGIATRFIGFLIGRYIGAFKAVYGPVRMLGATGVKAFNWLTRAAGNVISFIAAMPGKISSAASGMWDGIKNAFRDALNWIIGKWNGLEFGIPGFDPPGPGPKFDGIKVGTPDIPLLWQGGTVAAAGAAVVGDRGPELLSLPRGARVDPLPRSGRIGFGGRTTFAPIAANASDGDDDSVPYLAILNIDGRAFMEAAGRAVRSREARIA